MEKVVVDSSVVVKWFVEEEYSPKARQLLQDHIEEKITLWAPDIVIIEVINALSFRANFTGRELKEVTEKLYNLEIQLVPLDYDLVSEAIDIMTKNHLTSYDSLFITLAESEGISLITADKKHHKKEISKYIRYLGS